MDFRRRRAQVRGAPFRLWIETASCCNLCCVMCPNKELAASEKGLMSFDLFRKIIDECRSFVSDVYLHHRGEPLLNPALFDMIAYARKAGLKTRFHTNGTLLDEDKARRLLTAGPDLVSFSFDGFSKEIYETVRTGAIFETTLANIIRLAELRKKRGLAKPYIVIEKIRFQNMPAPTDRRQIIETERQLRIAGIDEIIEKEEYIWAAESAPETTVPPPGSVCTFPWYAAVICADGTVTPCPQDFHAYIKLGNIKEATLLEIWNGTAYQNLRGKMVADLQALALCRKCDRLCRKTAGGLPLQYLATFLIDHLLGYGKLRKMLGTQERN
ncbi:MAG: radical SAM/SPASM domain-containing protein [Kiritimatiellia bacterium]|nr:radical SAM/SPASM domain-containing protein [Kiritimatiellia bacterium]